MELAEGGNTVQWAVVTRMNHDTAIEDVFVVFRGTSSVADVIAVREIVVYVSLDKTYVCL